MNSNDEEVKITSYLLQNSTRISKAETPRPPQAEIKKKKNYFVQWWLLEKKWWYPLSRTLQATGVSVWSPLPLEPIIYPGGSDVVSSA